MRTVLLVIFIFIIIFPFISDKWHDSSYVSDDGWDWTIVHYTTAIDIYIYIYIYSNNTYTLAILNAQLIVQNWCLKMYIYGTWPLISMYIRAFIAKDVKVASLELEKFVNPLVDILIL